jgi:predicted nucleic acid-binding protein
VKFWDSSAVARLEREGNMAAREVQAALARLDLLAEAWAQVEPGPDLQRLARRLLRTHPLRAADALQLAAALIAADGKPRRMPFVCRDERLRVAADREGLPLV